MRPVAGPVSPQTSLAGQDATVAVVSPWPCQHPITRPSRARQRWTVSQPIVEPAADQRLAPWFVPLDAEHEELALDVLGDLLTGRLRSERARERSDGPLDKGDEGRPHCRGDIGWEGSGESGWPMGRGRPTRTGTGAGRTP
jgi:hypothetical protein